jgi:hypothetical protein
MARLARKNLVVDAEKVRELARRRATSESDAVRQAVDFALVPHEVMAAVRELHERGGIDDVFGRLPDEAGPATTWPTSSSWCPPPGSAAWSSPPTSGTSRRGAASPPRPGWT